MKIRVALLRLAPSMMKPLALGITSVTTGVFSSFKSPVKLPGVPPILVIAFGKGGSGGRASVK
ncbi:hypothetical protein D3C72_2587960 [compost metagenome]